MASFNTYPSVIKVTPSEINSPLSLESSMTPNKRCTTSIKDKSHISRALPGIMSPISKDRKCLKSTVTDLKCLGSNEDDNDEEDEVDKEYEDDRQDDGEDDEEEDEIESPMEQDDVDEAMIIADMDPSSKAKQSNLIIAQHQYEKQFVKLVPRQGKAIKAPHWKKIFLDGSNHS